MQNRSFVLDKENLLKAARIPVIIAGALGLTWLLKIYLGYLYSPTLTFLEALAGALYMKAVLDSDKTVLLINSGLNGAILGAVTILAYQITSEVSSSIVSQTWSIDGMAIITSTLVGGFIGLLGAWAWFAFMTNEHN